MTYVTDATYMSYDPSFPLTMPASVSRYYAFWLVVAERNSTKAAKVESTGRAPTAWNASQRPI